MTNFVLSVFGGVAIVSGATLIGLGVGALVLAIQNYRKRGVFCLVPPLDEGREE